MSDFTPQELARIKEERGLNQAQLNCLQRAATQYAGKVNKTELLNIFRGLGYMASMFEEDLKSRFGSE